MNALRFVFWFGVAVVFAACAALSVSDEEIENGGLL